VGRYLDTRFGPIHHVDFGGSGQPIVMVHGLGGSSTNWNAVGAGLTHLGNVVGLDLPGFGLTPPGPNFRLETHRNALEAYVEEIGGPVIMIANSTGGLVSEMLGASRPELISKMVLVSPATPPRLPDARLDWPTVFRLVVQATPGLGELHGRWFLRRHTPEELVRLSFSMVTHKPGRVPLHVVEASHDMARIRKHLPWSEVATARTATSIATHYLRRAEFVKMIKSIRVPVLIVQGLEDHIVSPTAVEWLASLRPDWDLVQMEDTGHTPQLDAPLRTLEIIAPWLAPNDADPGSVTGQTQRQKMNRASH
jgi:pimeloyl-ACP methyl ester carboxylesterase